jgi:hypothetical protein
MRRGLLLILGALMSVGIGDAVAKDTGAGSELEDSPKNAIYVEAVGGALGFPLPSLNYERMFSTMGVRAGLAVQPDSYNGVTMFAIPLTIHWVGLKSSSGVHRLELGLGALLLANHRDDSYHGYGDWFGYDGTNCDDCEPGTTDTTVGFHGVVGYRMQMNWFQLRVGLSPTLLFGKFLPVPHLSAGYVF